MRGNGHEDEVKFEFGHGIDRLLGKFYAVQFLPKRFHNWTHFFLILWGLTFEAVFRCACFQPIPFLHLCLYPLTELDPSHSYHHLISSHSVTSHLLFFLVSELNPFHSPHSTSPHPIPHALSVAPLQVLCWKPLPPLSCLPRECTHWWGTVYVTLESWRTIHIGDWWDVPYCAVLCCHWWRLRCSASLYSVFYLISCLCLHSTLELDMNTIELSSLRK